MSAVSSNVHPVFAPILAAITHQALILRRAAYIGHLRSHDWAFEFSDDARAYRTGRDSLAALRAEQREIDADGAIWNSVAPAGQKVGAAE